MTCDRYHVTRFVLARLGELPEAELPSEPWRRALLKMFRGDVPDAILARLDPVSSAALRAERDARALRRQQADAKRAAWIARRDAGNRRAQEQRAAATRAQAEAAAAHHKRMDASYCAQMQPIWNAAFQAFVAKRQAALEAALKLSDAPSKESERAECGN